MMPASSNRRAGTLPRFEYDVCLSFAGENRSYVKAVARHLSSRGLRVFYDEDKIVDLWGKNLTEHFHHIYSKASRYCIMFISEAYRDKNWTVHERRSAQERMLEQRSEYILPAHFDRTQLAGLPSTTGRISLTRYSPKQFAELVVTKIRPELLVEIQSAANYFPPNPDLLFKALRLKTKAQREVAQQIAYRFYSAVLNMNASERAVIGIIFAYGCPGDLPKFMHLNGDVARRIAKIPLARLAKILTDIRSLGFISKKKRMHGQFTTDVLLSWEAVVPGAAEVFGSDVNHTPIVAELIFTVASHYCEQHFLEMLKRANFSSLSSATAIEHRHE